MAEKSQTPGVIGSTENHKVRGWLGGWLHNHSAVVATVALLISVITAVVGVFALRNQSDQMKLQSSQLSVQKEQLAIQSQQLDNGQGHLSIEAKVQIEQGDHTYSDRIQRQIVDSDVSPMKPDTRVFVLADVTNTGGSSIGVRYVGVRPTNGNAAWSRIWCSNPKSAPLEKCNLPIKIEAQDTAAFYVILDDYIKSTVDCFNTVHADSRPNNIEFALGTLDKRAIYSDTKASIYWYDQCSNPQSSIAPPPTTTPNG